MLEVYRIQILNLDLDKLMRGWDQYKLDFTRR